MSKKFKMMFLCLVIGLTTLVATGCSEKHEGPPSLNIVSTSDKSFNTMIVQYGDEEETIEGIDGEDISNNLISAFELPEEDSVKVKVTLKKKGKTVATSPELELNLKKKKYYKLSVVDVSDKDVELKIEKR